MEVISHADTPCIEAGHAIEYVAYVRHGNVTMTRALIYANSLVTTTASGVETFTGWCKFDKNGKRLDGIIEGEVVFAWDTPKKTGKVVWTRHPIRPNVPKGEVKEFLISFMTFGSSVRKTRVAYYANEYRDMRGPTNRGIPTYSGWLTGHPGSGMQAFITIGDTLMAWAELPECEIDEE